MFDDGEYQQVAGGGWVVWYLVLSYTIDIDLKMYAYIYIRGRYVFLSKWSCRFVYMPNAFFYMCAYIQVEDVSLAAVFMCSPAAGWITATRLTIDGGSWHGGAGFLDAKRAIEAKSEDERKNFKGGVSAGKARL